MYHFQAASLMESSDSSSISGASVSFPRTPPCATRPSESGHHYSSSRECECSSNDPSSPGSKLFPQLYESDFPIVIDTFAPKPFFRDMSPTSSTSSDLDHFSPSNSTSRLQPGRSMLDEFLTTRSRIVRLFRLPHVATSSSELDVKVALFNGLLMNANKTLPTPVTMWMLREDFPAAVHERDSVWAVFRFHEEACAALSLSGSVISVMPALESDLEPFHKLKRFEPHDTLPPHPSSSQPVSRMSVAPSSNSLQQVQVPESAANIDFDPSALLPRRDYVMSSNPPNPRTNFRLGDWICTSPSCAAHNFGRNITCINCGRPRGPPAPHLPRPHSPAWPLPSPRFVASSSSMPVSYSSISPHNQLNATPFPNAHPPIHLPHSASQWPSNNKPSGLSHPLLTPSGRAFASGGKVQNISSDPLAPCVMYWPGNEPLPEQGQIRPSSLTGVPQPPILNTGNRGPIEHQPGDWVCLKCNYLNWRRRKVCQTCFPYAEGNGDSISAAVQAERIALLTSVLSQNRHVSNVPSMAHPVAPSSRSQSIVPSQNQCPFVDVSAPKPHGTLPSESQLSLNAQYASPRPIYQTSGHHNHSPLPAGSSISDHMHTPTPLLPSFLQDIIQSPTLSPSSTSSVDLSFEEYDETPPLPSSSKYPRACRPEDPTLASPPSSIWRLDGEETKSFTALAFKT